ncbi:MAG: CZB domain-containing protein [Thiotrichaceae bacterium]|nr:CZB domain-containing protein [Thiotrichaceae bacterium]
MDSDKIKDIIWAHSLWKQHLRKAIESGSCHLSVEEAGNEKKCHLGKWLASEEAQTLPNYAELVEIHHHFHRQAAQILQLALNGNRHEALNAMAMGSYFNKLTSQLVNAINEINHH